MIKIHKIDKELTEQCSSCHCENSEKDMNLIKIWDSCMEVCNTLGFNMSNLRGCLSGHRKTTHGYIWKYYEEG